MIGQGEFSVVQEITSVVGTFKNINKYGKLSNQQIAKIIGKNLITYGDKKALNALNKVTGECLQNSGLGDGYFGHLAKVTHWTVLKNSNVQIQGRILHVDRQNGANSCWEY